MTKLTDTQLTVLTAASRRDDGAILPLPKNLKGGAATKVVDALIRKGFVECIAAGSPAGDTIPKITRQGLEAIGSDPDKGARAAEGGQSSEPAPSARRKASKAATAPEGPKAPRKVREGTKQAALIDMLRREEGATIGQIVEATGWRSNTIRGAISGALKKKLGLTVTSEKNDGGERAYRIIDAA